MKVKVFDLVFSPEEGRLGDDEMQEFLEGKEVLSSQQHFYEKEGEPHLVMVVSYREERNAARSRAGELPAFDEKKDWREEMPGEDKAVYDFLRAFRVERSRADKRPPYAIMTNRQMAEVVKKKPTTKADLRTIQGMGGASGEKYAEAILEALGVALGRVSTEAPRQAATSEEPAEAMEVQG